MYMVSKIDPNNRSIKATNIINFPLNADYEMAVDLVLLFRLNIMKFKSQV